MPATARRRSRKGAVAPLAAFRRDGVAAVRQSAAAASVASPPLQMPVPAAAARDADVVAIVSVHEEIPVPAEALAEAGRLWRAPPRDTPVSFPGPASPFHVLRVLKGALPPGMLLRNGGTSCEVRLPAGHDYLLFAKLPSPDDGALLWPMRGTFVLDGSDSSRAGLAGVELALSSLKPTP